LGWGMGTVVGVRVDGFGVKGLGMRIACIVRTGDGGIESIFCCFYGGESIQYRVFMFLNCI
jgi:hypothetical protein